MDGVSAAVGIVGFAVQLAGNVKKLIDFWESIADTPENIRAIIADLRLLHTILDSIRQYEASSTHSDPALDEALQSASTKISSLRDIIDGFEHDLSSAHLLKRKWSGAKAVLKFAKVNAFRQSLEETKTTLILAKTHSIRYEKAIICNYAFLIKKCH